MGLRILLRILHVVGVIVSVLAEIEMEFIKHPESIAAPVGDEVSFECSVRVPGERLAWRWRPDDDQEWKDWTEVNGINDKESISTRLIVQVGEDTPTALYQCVVWYGAISLVSNPARLSIAKVDLSKNKQDRRVIIAPLYNTIVLHCREPLSEPPARLSWWKETSKGSRKSIDTPFGVLVINNATVEDSGTYGCTATNDISDQTIDLPERTYLKIQDEENGRYRFLESEDYVGTVEEGVLTRAVPAGGALRLWCGAVGRPAPAAVWSAPAAVWSAPAAVWSGPAAVWSAPAAVRSAPAGGAPGQLLLVEQFSVQHEGVYSCSANGIRRSWKVVALRSPRWEGAAASVNVSEGSLAVISCGIPHGEPRPKVHWLLNAETIKTGKGVVATESSLRISHVEKRHAGIVQCAACSGGGRGARVVGGGGGARLEGGGGGASCALDAALLTVVPVQVNDPDYSVEEPKTMHIPSQPPKRHSKKNSRKHKAVLIPPSRPNVTRLSDESAMVSWSHDNHGLPIQFFKVQYKEVTNSSNVQWHTANHDIPAHIHSFEIDGLIPDKYYKFRIAAVYSNQDNKLGRSSGKFFLQRGGFRGPRTPILERATALSPHSIRLDWTLPEGGVSAEGFYVYYRAVSLAGAYEKATAGGEARALSLAHLAPDTAYDLKLQAYTARAPSGFSAILTARTLRSPSAPPPRAPPPPARSAAAPSALLTAGGAGAAVLLLLAAVLLLCRRRRPAAEEKGPVPENPNGYLAAKVPITITANPMHGEGGEAGVEMSFLHNNNCGNNTDSDDATSRKNGPSRQYV